jgi:hypothetical protein
LDAKTRAGWMSTQAVRQLTHSRCTYHLELVENGEKMNVQDCTHCWSHPVLWVERVRMPRDFVLDHERQWSCRSFGDSNQVLHRRSHQTQRNKTLSSVHFQFEHPPTDFKRTE